MRTNSIIGAAALSLLVSRSALAQATFELANKHTPVVDAPVFGAEGVPLAGTNYLAELWGAATPDQLMPLVVLDEGHIREIVPFISRGYFASGESSLSVLTVPPKGWAWLQVRAWDAQLGATYEDVVELNLGGYGESPLFYAKGGDPFDLLGLAPPLVGLQSFSLRPVVPEPSTWALCGFGGLGVWWAVRRRGRR